MEYKKIEEEKKKAAEEEEKLKKEAQQKNLEEQKLKNAEEARIREKERLEKEAEQKKVDEQKRQATQQTRKELQDDLQKVSTLAIKNLELANQKDRELNEAKKVIETLEKERVEMVRENTVKDEERDRKIGELEKQNELLKNGNSDQQVKELLRVNKDLENQLEIVKRDAVNEKNKTIDQLKAAVRKQNENLEVYRNLQIKKPLTSGNLDDSNQKDLSKLILVESDALDLVMERLYAFNQLKYKNMRGKEVGLRKVEIRDFPKSLYNLNDRGAREAVDKLIEEFSLKGMKGELMTMSDQIQNAILESHFETAYGGKDHLSLSFKHADQVISEVDLSNLALQSVDPSGQKYFVIPMQDTESYDKVYHKISSLGKGVVESEGELIVRRSGYEPLAVSYNMDYEDIGEELYFGQSFVFSKDDGVKLHTKFMNEKNHQLVSVIIPEDAFTPEPVALFAKKSLSLSASLADSGSESESEQEVFEVPIYQTPP